MRFVTLSALVATLGIQSAAFAAPPETEPQPEKKVFNFDADTISTDYLKPGTLLIEGVTRGRRSSLIEVRLDFVSEILRSADDI
jgi:hypothetical protein